MELPRLNVEPKTGKEHFRTGNTNLAFTVHDFWQWTASDLFSNATRGLVAEFIVASATNGKPLPGSRLHTHPHKMSASTPNKDLKEILNFPATMHQRRRRDEELAHTGRCA